MQLRDCLHCRLRFLSFAADLHVLLLVDQERKPLAHQGMVIDHQNGFLAGLHGPSRYGLVVIGISL